MTQTLVQPVIRGVRFFLAHTPGLVRYGSKPSRDMARDATIADTIAAHLRSYEAAMAYPPNRAFLATCTLMPSPPYPNRGLVALLRARAGVRTGKSCRRRNFTGS